MNVTFRFIGVFICLINVMNAIRFIVSVTTSWISLAIKTKIPATLWNNIRMFVLIFFYLFVFLIKNKTFEIWEWRITIKSKFSVFVFLFLNANNIIPGNKVLYDQNIGFVKNIVKIVIFKYLNSFFIILINIF